jgi:serine/threonine protein kinase
LALTAGARLGPYEIVSALGAGGMGEVYRATDIRLKRQVAVKVLPPLLATDPDRLARFQREAEILASLNHPHIAAIHGWRTPMASRLW